MKAWTTSDLLRAWVMAGALCGGMASSQAQEAVPYYGVAAWLESIERARVHPQAQAFSQAAEALVQALAPPCDAARLRAAQAPWTQAMLRWENLSAVSVGPVLARRTARAIDFEPTRPLTIEALLAQPPVGPAALERVGAPAKGLPALEFVLWRRSEHPGACAYAALLAQDLLGEAQAVQAAAAADAVAEEGDEAVLTTQVAELINQTAAGLDSLRWRSMGKPLAQARRGQPGYPRALSGQVRPAWSARWAGLRELLVQADAPVPPLVRPMTAPVPIATFLRSQGLLALAQRLDAATALADARMAAAQPLRAGSVAAAVKALVALRQLVETEVAEALHVSIGFSDADGD